ncbi:unnamed protein product (macronuclear) [Paramecium tetraurelia]|uniref:Uncharacterized protein n=1 Tax=Paramecium tetraurelia TaxID=5888 RepID=A0CXQ3_PARTE|nr:uncharacterized protein GSPATT00011202001 [Paramecium tetraurelia]CAK75570.1 unnamed protein product [Paramecium tetraurelia]|eukprot:XP_001442967.1 hypothetical protein (macronuclear) [Paramecium tetraurelia strain d4-2]
MIRDQIKNKQSGQTQTSLQQYLQYLQFEIETKSIMLTFKLPNKKNKIRIKATSKDEIMRHFQNELIIYIEIYQGALFIPIFKHYNKTKVTKPIKGKQRSGACIFLVMETLDVSLPRVFK